MQQNRKCDNKNFELIGSTLHLYDNIVEVISGEDEHIEYDCDMYTVQTTLTGAEVMAQFVALLLTCKEKEAKDKALADARQAEQNLLDTDWVENQLSRCSLLYGVESVEYSNLFARRKDLLLQREAWVEIVRNAETL